MQILKNFFLKISKREAIRKAMTCKGYTKKSKLSLLFSKLYETKSLPGDILEIGSAWGRTLVLFGLASSKTIWSIDPHTGGLAFILKNESANSFEECNRNLEKFNLISRVNILKHTTKTVVDSGLVPNQVKFSLVFIDGLHTAEAVKIDFDFAYERLNSSGVMLFDDYFEPSVLDYSQMIDSLISQKNLDLIKDKNARLAYFIKP